MRIILTSDVSNLGRAGEIKSVRDGYARNFLFPKKLAALATPAAIAAEARSQADQARREDAERRRLAELAEQLQSLTLRFTLTVGETGMAFGSVSKQDIAQELGRQGLKIERDWIELPEPIKTAGEHQAAVVLPRGGSARLAITVDVQKPPAKKRASRGRRL